MRTFLVLCVIATVGVVGSSVNAEAADIPPTVEFTFSCGVGNAFGLIEWEATNVDFDPHNLDEVSQPDGDVTPAPLAAFQASVGGSSGVGPGLVAGYDILEDGVLIATSGLQVVDLSEPDCWGDAPNAIAPIVVFAFGCSDNGGSLLEWEATNIDLASHSLEEVLQPNGISSSVPLGAGQASVGNGAGASDGTVTGFDIFENGVLLGSSGLQIADPNEPDCWAPFEPIDQVPAEPVPPSIEVEVACSAINPTALIDVIATNNDGGAHGLLVTMHSPSASDDEPLALAAGDDVQNVSAFALVGEKRRVVVTEGNTVLLDTGFFMIGGGPSMFDCASAIPAEAPTVTFETHCDDGGAVVEIHIVNNDLQDHDVHAFLEPVGGVLEELLVPDLVNEPAIEVDKFVPFGTTFQVTVKEGDAILGVSPLWQALADDGFCAVEPDPDLPFVPLGDPDDQTTPSTVPEPEPTTTTTTPETTTTVTEPEQPVVEAFTVGETDRSFTPAPAGSAGVPAVEPARSALPRTGAPIQSMVVLAWLLIGAGCLVKRAAARR